MRLSLRIVLPTLFLSLAALPVRAAEVSFVREVAPILLTRCTGCHGDKKNSGGYRVHTFEFLQKIGKSGALPIVAGQPEKSEILKRIVSMDADERMPQDDDPLSASQTDIIRRWIKEGAKFDGADAKAPLKDLLGARQHPLSPAVYRVAVPVMALALAPGGQEIFAGGYNEIAVWNAATGALVRRLQHLPQRIRAIVFSPDGKQLLVAGGTPGEYGEVMLVNPATGAVKSLDTFGDIVLAATFSADGKTIAAGCADATVRAYNAQNGSRLWASKVHSDWVTGVSFSADGHYLASSSKDMTVKVYDAASGALYTTYNGHKQQYGPYKGQDPVYGVQFLPDSPLACSAGGGKWLQLWDPVKAHDENGTAADMEDRFAKQGHTKYIENGFTREIFALRVKDGQVFAASAEGLVKQFDLASMKEVRSYPGHTDWVFAVDYDAPSHRAVSGAYDGQIRVWDTQTGQCTATFQAQPGAANAKIQAVAATR